jgi:hypothetical protein
LPARKKPATVKPKALSAEETANLNLDPEAWPKFERFVK